MVIPADVGTRLRKPDVRKDPCQGSVDASSYLTFDSEG